jgi:hypothetical protein
MARGRYVTVTVAAAQSYCSPASSRTVRVITGVGAFSLNSGQIDGRAVQRVPPSIERRRKRLDVIFPQLLDENLDGCVQSFDLTAAIAAGTIAATRQRVGRAVEIRDVQIAGIAGTQLWLPAILATSPKQASTRPTPGTDPHAPDSMRMPQIR